MGVSVKHIDTPQEWEDGGDFYSHRPLLYLTFNRTIGVIIEFGCGKGSTELTRGYCKEKKRLFFSFETNEEWANEMGATHIKDSYLSISHGEKMPVIFVDSAPSEERKYLIAKYAYSAEAIIVHDTEPGSDWAYKTNEILSTFKYRLDFRPEGSPHTTVVSNFVNVEKWV